MIKTIGLNIVCALFAVTSNAILKHALTGRLRWEGDVTSFCAALLALFKLPLIWVGGLAFVMTNVFWLLILSGQQMSVAYPLQISLVFLFSTIVSVAVFSDRLTGTGYAGLVLILAGILMLKQGTLPA